MRLLFLSLILFFSTLLSASAVIGSIEKADGTVKVKNSGSFKKSKVKSGYEIKEGDLLSTSRKANAVLKLKDGSNVILSASSTINFKSVTDVEQLSGKVFYKITSRDAKNSLKVKTPFAIIGIKGTTFVVNSDKGSEKVSLKEGLIGVASIEAQFSLYRKEVLAAYNNYVSNQMEEFEKFKSGGKKPEPEITKEFDLKQGNSVSFSDNVVKESGWDDESDLEFTEFEKLIDPNYRPSFSEEKPTSVKKSVEKKVATTVKKLEKKVAIVPEDSMDDLDNEPSRTKNVHDAMKESMNFD